MLAIHQQIIITQTVLSRQQNDQDARVGAQASAGVKSGSWHKRSFIVDAIGHRKCVLSAVYTRCQHISHVTFLLITIRLSSAFFSDYRMNVARKGTYQFMFLFRFFIYKLSFIFIRTATILDLQATPNSTIFKYFKEIQTLFLNSSHQKTLSYKPLINCNENHGKVHKIAHKFDFKMNIGLVIMKIHDGALRMTAKSLPPQRHSNPEK